MLSSLMQEVVLTGCCHENCHALIAMARPIYDRAQNDPDEWFHCSNGHRQHFIESARDKRYKEQLAQARQATDHQTQLRLEAEKRAARQEEERLRVQRELAEARRTMRKGLTVAAHVVKKTRQRREDARR